MKHYLRLVRALKAGERFQQRYDKIAYTELYLARARAPRVLLCRPRHPERARRSGPGSRGGRQGKEGLLPMRGDRVFRGVI